MIGHIKLQLENNVLSLNKLSRLFRIGKQTIRTYKSLDDRFLKKYAHMKSAVLKVIRSHQAYGIRRIKAALMEEENIFIGRDALARLLTLWGLGLPRKVKKKQLSFLQKILKVLGSRCNLLKRFTPTRLFQVLTTDITVLYFKTGKCYFCVHKDIIGQEVYGWAISKRGDVLLALKSLKHAYRSIRRYLGKIPEGLIVHQDQGSVYTSYAYTDAVLKHGRLSYSEKGKPTDNPGQESFFGRFKEEWADEIAELETFEAVEKFVKRKMHYYNNRRLHTSLKYKAPATLTKIILSLSQKSVLKS